MNIIFITLHFWVCHTSHLHSPHHCGSLLKFLLCIVEWMHIYPKTCWLSKIAGKYLVATSSSILSYCQFLSPLLWNNFALLLQLCFYAHNKLIFFVDIAFVGCGLDVMQISTTDNCELHVYQWGQCYGLCRYVPKVEMFISLSYLYM